MSISISISINRGITVINLHDLESVKYGSESGTGWLKLAGSGQIEINIFIPAHVAKAVARAYHDAMAIDPIDAAIKEREEAST